MAFKDYSVGVNLIGRDVSASKALNKLGFAAKSTGDKLAAASKKANYVLGTMTASAVLFAKAAMEDQKSATILAKTLENVAGAGTKQVAKVEEFIKVQSMTAAVADDEIRPAFDRLVRSTRNIGEAQKLTTLALEIAAAKGKSVEEVANALAKANDGNVNSLKRLGIAVPKATKGQKVYATQLKVVNGQLKQVQVAIGKTSGATAKFSDVVQQLGKDFKGSIEAQMGTAAYKFAKFKVVLGETQETLGYMLLPYLEDLSGLLIKIAPWVERNKENIKKWAIAIGSVAIAVKAVNAAYKTFQAMQIAGMLIRQTALWAGYGTTVTVAGGEIAAAGTAVQVAWAPFLLTVAAIAAAFVGINLALDKIEKKRAAKIAKIEKEGWAATDLQNQYGITPDRLARLSQIPTEMRAVPRHAKGGIVTKPHLGIVGEAGPEAIIPLNKFGSFGGVTVVNHIQGSVMSEKELALVVRNGIAQLMRRKGLNPSIIGV